MKLSEKLIDDKKQELKAINGRESPHSIKRKAKLERWVEKKERSLDVKRKYTDELHNIIKKIDEENK